MVAKGVVRICAEIYHRCRMGRNFNDKSSILPPTGNLIRVFKLKGDDKIRFHFTIFQNVMNFCRKFRKVQRDNCFH